MVSASHVVGLAAGLVLGAPRRSRAVVAREVAHGLDRLVPMVLDEVLNRVRLTDLVLRHVNLDELVAAVDVQRVVDRVEIEPVLDRIDLTATVLERVDLAAVLGAVLGRLDVDAVVERVDVGAVVERVDVDAVAGRLDLENLIRQLDLTALVLEHVDLDAVLDDVLARMDLVALAEQVIDGVDLPAIIRASTGSMASETVQEVRMQGIAADQAVTRAMDRLLRRGRSRALDTGRAAPQEDPAEPAPALPVPGRLTSAVGVDHEDEDVGASIPRQRETTG